MSDAQPPAPDGVRTLDELITRLRQLRSWSGLGYHEVHRRVAELRQPRGIPEGLVYNTVYRCFQPGRSRLDVELVVDVARVLLGDDALAAQWRSAYQVVTGLATEAEIVSVSWRLPDEPGVFTGRLAELEVLLAPDAAPVVARELEATVCWMAERPLEPRDRRPPVALLRVPGRGDDDGDGRALRGLDSLLSIVQMPAGVPVGTLAIGRAGAINAALLAAAILALGDPALAQALAAWRAQRSAAVAENQVVIANSTATVADFAWSKPSRVNRNAMTAVANTSKKPSTHRCTSHQRQYSTIDRCVCSPHMRPAA